MIRRNIIAILLSVELMLNATNINFVAFSDHLLFRTFRDEQTAGVGFRAAVLKQAHVIATDDSVRGFDLVADASHLFHAESHVCPGRVLDRLDGSRVG